MQGSQVAADEKGRRLRRDRCRWQAGAPAGDDGARRLPAIIAYIAERTRFRRRWIGALERLDIPALVAWGKRDPVCAVEIAEQLAREIEGAELTVWDDLGHYPQVEAPEVVAGVIDAFLERVERVEPG